MDTYCLLSGNSLVRQRPCSGFIIALNLHRCLHTNVQEDRVTTENNEEQFVKPGYIDLLNNPDYYHHIEATANKKQLRLDNVDHSISNLSPRVIINVLDI